MFSLISRAKKDIELVEELLSNFEFEYGLNTSEVKKRFQSKLGKLDISERAVSIYTLITIISCSELLIANENKLIIDKRGMNNLEWEEYLSILGMEHFFPSVQILLHDYSLYHPKAALKKHIENFSFDSNRELAAYTLVEFKIRVKHIFEMHELRQEKSIKYSVSKSFVQESLAII